MEHKLINNGLYLLVVSDDEIKEGDYGYYMAGKSIQKVKIDENYSNPKAHKKIICHLPINNSPIISDLDLLPPLEQEDDVEKLAIDEYEQAIKRKGQEYAGGYFEGLIDGYNKAKEKYFKPIPDWVYTRLCTYDNRNPYYLPYDEDDITRKPTDCNCDNCFYGRTKMAEFILSIQSLSQPKLPVAFNRYTEQVLVNGYKNQSENVIGFVADYETRFKTITNSQGQTVWVGEYIY